MPRVTIAKKDYDEIVWPAVAMRTMGEGEDPTVADTLLTKLEAVGGAEAFESENGDPLPPAEDAPYVMAEGSAELEISDEEAALLSARLAAERRRHATRRMRVLLPLMQSLDEAVESARVAQEAGRLDDAIASRQETLATLNQEIADARSEIARLQDEIAREGGAR